MSSSSADRRIADLVNLKDVLEIVEIINAHTDEDELIHAVLDKVFDYKLAAVIVFRRLSRDGTTLAPFIDREGVSPLEKLLHTTDVPLDSYEGHAMRENRVVAIGLRASPRSGLTRVTSMWSTSALREVLLVRFSTRCDQAKPSGLCRSTALTT